MMHKKEEIKKIRNRIRKNWDLDEKDFEKLLEDQYGKVQKKAYEDGMLFEFLNRFCSLYKSLFVNTRKQVRTNHSDKNNLSFEDVNRLYSDRFTFFWSWVLQKKIEKGAEYLYSLIIAEFELKDWIDEDLKAQYLKRELESVNLTLFSDKIGGKPNQLAARGDLLRSLSFAPRRQRWVRT